MKDRHILIATAITNMLVLGLAATAGSAHAAADEEKCFGVAKAGQNVL